MTPAGWIFMLASVSAVTCLMVWCFYHVLTRPQTIEHMHSPRNIEPMDEAGP